MKTNDSKRRLSPAICWSLCAFFAVITILWQFVDVVPYPNMNRDYVLGTLLFSGVTVLFLLLARMA
jgi:hypothetical protein